MLVRNQGSSIRHIFPCVCVYKEPTASNEPSFLPGNLAEMQHGVLSVSVNFLALEPGVEKGKKSEIRWEKTPPSPNLIKCNNYPYTLILYSFQGPKSRLLILFSFIFRRPLKVAMVTAPKCTEVNCRHMRQSVT